MIETISKSKLKSKMLEIFRQLEASGQELIITDHDRPVLKIVPIKQKMTVAELFGDVQGHVIIPEDINQPTQDEWEDV
jgi:antitoxin (DNA-binding transcriptional repressor) of toxin-antitoxin stability system